MMWDKVRIDFRDVDLKTIKLSTERLRKKEREQGVVIPMPLLEPKSRNIPVRAKVKAV